MKTFSAEGLVSGFSRRNLRESVACILCGSSPQTTVDEMPEQRRSQQIIEETPKPVRREPGNSCEKREL
jgi:hypothetical protein